MSDLAEVERLRETIMILKFLITLILQFIVIISTVTADTLSYTCEVTHVYGLADDGTLESAAWNDTMKGKLFSVSRVTGEIIGGVIPTLLANSTKVINKGNEGYSFKSIADFDAVDKPLSSGTEDAISTASLQLLEVQEFHDGARKPFIAMSMGGAGIVTGLCK